MLLAAGRGTRLGALTERTPKCLLPVAGRTLLDHHLHALEAAGIEDVTIVAGFEAERVIKQVAGRCRVIVNPDYATTNSIVSLHLAGPYVRGHPFLYQNADVLYAPELVRRLVVAPPANACLVDPFRPHTDGEDYVALDDGRIVEFSHSVPPDRSVGRSAQLDKIGAAASAAFLDRLGEAIAAGGHRQFPRAGFDALMKGDGLWPVYTAGLPWWEVDTPDDYVQCSADYPPREPDPPERAPLTLRKLGSFVARPRVPWRYRWVPMVARSGVRHPVGAARSVPALNSGRLSPAGADLRLNGLGILAQALSEAARAGLRPFLLWGSLLGCVRDGGFITNDHDIDLGVLQDDAARLPGFRDAMVARGFGVRIERPGKLSVVHPRHPRLFVDVDVVERWRDRWAISTTDPDSGRVFRYVFPPAVFPGTRPARFAGRLDVLLPAEPEGFLEATYGPDWRLPAPKLHYVYGPFNLRIEVPDQPPST